MTTTVLGIRHHGPGSARSVLAELDRLGPDTVLIEGPADANATLALAAHEKMQPPVALLIYAPDDPHVATFYPFASFSPEWVAIRWALEREVPVSFIDLAAGIQFALAKEAAERRMAAAATDGTPGADEPALEEVLRTDPLNELARAAGDEDGERFWDRLVESRRTPGDLFAAVADAMTAVRGALPERDTVTLQREAAMRRGIREARRAGRTNVAVVCGAWHAPALEALPTAAEDDRLLKPLPR